MIRAAVAFVVGLLVTAPANAGLKASITEVEGLGGSSSYLSSINDRGQAVGVAYTANNAADHAFLYDGGATTDLGTFGGNYSLAYGINGRGQVVGQAYTANDAAWHAFLYAGGAMTDLGTLGGTSSFAFGINDRGL